ncbi:MAG: hypothetical protein JW843_03655 [Candidatus Aminicenantes bacterium]|nr:hypothetical protein [Candidatus Aminicenantes bacterium]
MTLSKLESKLFWPLMIVCALALVFAACGKSGKDETGAGEAAGSAGGPSAEAADAYAGWVEYISDPMGFNVMVPQPMIYSTERKETAAGPTDLHYFLAEVGAETYGVICNDFSGDFAAKVDQKDFLDKGIKGFVDNLAGTVTSERDVALDGQAGREIVLTGSSGGAALYGKARFFLIGSRLYQVAYIAELGKEKEAAVDHFLDSFKLK